MAFNAKNLNYDRNEPAFLRRMKGDLSAGRDTDRHERPIARPKRLKRDEEDDGPTYVVEESNDTLTKAEYEALINGVAEQQSADVTENAAQKKDGDQTVAEAAKPKQQQVASVGGASKKRKAVKIGGDADEDEGEETGPAEKAEVQQKEAKTKKTKKKAKAIKLSFGGDEGEKT
ncbi:hypothetical protein GTA08_BOTSDO07927 [Botryosphaeria dothidea]|uniref:DUF4604 domain-containing protein n=1 Tax=Botryosphaeria dothidea TaxID=55169 RepID=A0A8H4INZ0_9PEZI|nr:hypothetical protein GTA08_BOTSDO07927 [Botryosphaeria dothidea]